MIFIYFALLGISGVISTPLNDYLPTQIGSDWIPNGRFKIIQNYEDPEEPAYDAYRDMEFRLYTNANGRRPELVEIDNAEELKKSTFDANLPTRFMIHGWGGNGIDDGAVILPMRAYLNLGNYNYFAVDWSKGSSSPTYLISRNRVNATGIVMGKFIEFLIRDGGINLDSVRIAGFSLGGQTVGYVGKYLNGQLPVIYSVDPAGPLFSENSNDRITYEDAKYVEVIHTNGLKLGYDKPLGHVDFYPNNGRSQPGCSNDLTGNCAHGRGLLYFVESITSETGFWGTRCDSREDIKEDGCVSGDGTLRKMGGDPKENRIVTQRQVFWMRTNNAEPFALGLAGTQ